MYRELSHVAAQGYGRGGTERSNSKVADQRKLSIKTTLMIAKKGQFGPLARHSVPIISCTHLMGIVQTSVSNVVFVRSPVTPEQRHYHDALGVATEFDTPLKMATDSTCLFC